jgi:hypothetical protein
MTEPYENPVLTANHEARLTACNRRLRAADAWRKILFSQHLPGELSDEGRAVLEDLFAQCNVAASEYVSDPGLRAYIDGRRSVALEITELLYGPGEALRARFLELFGFGKPRGPGNFN